MSGKRIEVDDRLLTAADRLYDEVDRVLQALEQSPPHRLQALERQRYSLRLAREGYDDAISREGPR